MTIEASVYKAGQLLSSEIVTPGKQYDYQDKIKVEGKRIVANMTLTTINQDQASLNTTYMLNTDTLKPIMMQRITLLSNEQITSLTIPGPKRGLKTIFKWIPTINQDVQAQNETVVTAKT